jgi:hypothetical protein
LEELEMRNGLEPVKRALKEFQKTYGEELWNTIFHRGEDPEDYLRAEVLCELAEAIERIQKLADYLNGVIIAEGVLSRRNDGGLSIGDRELIPGQEVEVFLYDPVFEAFIWTRASVSMEQHQRLIGLECSVKQEGLRARIREM